MTITTATVWPLISTFTSIVDVDLNLRIHNLSDGAVLSVTRPGSEGIKGWPNTLTLSRFPHSAKVTVLSTLEGLLTEFKLGHSLLK